MECSLFRHEAAVGRRGSQSGSALEGGHRRAVSSGGPGEHAVRSRVGPLVQFYGDRTAQIADPFGHRWSIATHVEDVPPEEIEKRMAEAMNA